MASITQQLPIVTPRDLWRKTFWRHARIPVIHILGCALVTALSLPYLHLDSQSNNMANEIIRQSWRRAELRREVSELQRQLATLGSLSNMTKRAAALGLQEDPEINVLAVDYQQSAPSGTDSPSPIAQSLDWFKALLNRGADGPGDIP